MVRPELAVATQDPADKLLCQNIDQDLIPTSKSFENH